MSLMNSFELAVLDAMLGGSATLLGGSLDVALSTTDPGEDGSGISEPSGFGYARKTITNDGSQWAAAALESGVATKRTNAQIEFAQASGGNWGLISHWVIYESTTPKIWGVLDDGAGTPLARQVNDGDTFRFLSGELRVTMD